MPPGSRRRRSLAWLSGLCVLFSAPRLAAESGTAEAPRWHAALEVGLIGHADAQSSLTVVSPMLGLDYRLTERFGVGVDWGFMVAAQAPVIGSALWGAGSGDPLFKAWYGRQSTDGKDRWYASAGITAPLAWLSYDIERRGFMRGGYAHAAATRGLWNVWLWGPEQLSLALNGLWFHALGSNFNLQLEAGAAGSRTISSVTRDVADAYGQLAAALELRQQAFGAGLRLQAVAMTSSSDALQLSFAPYVMLNLGAWVLMARAVVNLDPPLGVFNPGLGMWGGLLALRGSL